MSERDYEAEAREIAAMLGLSCKHDFEEYWQFGPTHGDVLFAGSDIWSALLRLARQPRGLPAEVPEGHERVRVGFNYARDIRGDWYVKDGFYKIFSDFVPSMYDGAAVFDVPLPKSVEIVGSVEP